jgi:hypothetical protein
MKNIHKISAGLAVVGFLIFAGMAYADTGATTAKFLGHGTHPLFARPIAGVVSVINGGSLTMTVQASSTAAITTYTVNISSARILRSGTTTSIGSIHINDKVAVIGIISGTNITAKVIFDGILPQTTGPPAGEKSGHGAGSGHNRPFHSLL